jgi:AcrR family transcriptional regulator
VVTAAGVSTRDFEREFSSIEECLCAAFEQGQELIARAMLRAVEGEQDWLTRVRLALISVLDFLDSAPSWGRLLAIEAPLRSTLVESQRKQALERLAQLLERGSPEAHHGLALHRRLTAELVIGGVFSVISSRMLRHRGLPLIDLAPALMSLIVLPYLGAKTASEELGRLPHAISAKQRLHTECRTRATYRTALVLRAIESSPHSSNREIAAAAGLTDEGQASRLLSRLKRQGLIENVGLGHTYGESNAWLLTAEGRRVSAMIGTQLRPKARRETKASRTDLASHPAEDLRPAEGSPKAKSPRPQAKTRKPGRASCQS